MKPRKRSSSIRASATIVGGNDDLLMEILLFLPTKSLIRFKLVSKHWRSLISAPSFTRLYLLHHRRRTEPHHSFILSGIKSQFFICQPTIKKLVPFTFPFRYAKILQSFHGLLLLECGNGPHGRKKEYHVFNPITMKSRNLFIERPFYALYLVFDPSKSCHYTVVCFRNVYRKTSFTVYDSRTHRWSDWVTSQFRHYKFRDGVYWKGGLYFIRRYEYKSYSFFLEDDGVRVLPERPRFSSLKDRRSYVMESNGHMHYVIMSLQPVKKCLFVSEMHDDESGWFTNFSVDLNPISTKDTTIDLLGIIRGEKEEDSILLFHVLGKITIYKVSDEVFEVLVDFRKKHYFKEDQLQCIKDAYQFIESYAPV